MRTLQRDALPALLADSTVARVFKALQAEGEETRLVGGCVRDALLGVPGSDVDLATTLLPDAVMHRAAAASMKVVPTGLEHGTISIVTGGTTLEVTTLREDVETDGRRAVVRFGRDFDADAARRDFTINALSLDHAGRLHDVTGGMADLEAGRVRFIGDASTRIREDALRILRFFRFHARFGAGAPDEEGLAASAAAADALDRLSRERVRSEMLKLLEAPGAMAAITTMDETGLLQRVIGTPVHPNRLARLIDADRGWEDDGSSARPQAVVRLAALGVGSPADAKRLRQALRLSNDEYETLNAYARALTEIVALKRIDGIDLRRLSAVHDLKALVPAIDAAGHLAGAATTDLARLRRGDLDVPVFPLTGAALMTAGLASGRAIGTGLSAARELWLERGCLSGDEEVAILVARALDAAGAAG